MKTLKVYIIHIGSKFGPWVYTYEIEIKKMETFKCLCSQV